MSDKIFSEGIYFNRKHEKAPDWVLGSIGINVKQFGSWLKANKEHIDERGYLKLDVLESKAGKPYCAVNTYVPDENKKESAPVEEDDDVPF